VVELRSGCVRRVDRHGQVALLDRQAVLAAVQCKVESRTDHVDHLPAGDAELVLGPRRRRDLLVDAHTP